MQTELIIASANGEKAYLPAVLEGVEWSTQRAGAPGRLTFKTAGMDAEKLAEGAAVRFSAAGQALFYGFIFTKRYEKNGVAAVTAYDQLRYFKNKDTYVYENKTASQLLRMLAGDFRLRTGEIEDTRHVIASRVEDNATLFDMMAAALDLTLLSTGEMYVLYDDAGALTLKNLRSMLVGGPGAYPLLEETNASELEYSESIDSGSASRVKLICDNRQTGRRDVYIAQSGALMNAWGVLQYFEKLSAQENGQAKADALLRLYGRASRSITVKKARGDVRVRGGSLLAARLTAGGKRLENLMLVEKAVHTFKEGAHTMDLTLRGGDYLG